MARLTKSVPYLIIKSGRKGGPPRYFWQPSTVLRAAGWPCQRLAEREPAATIEIEAIREAVAINKKLAAWRKNEQADDLVAARATVVTIDRLIAAYKLSRKWKKLAPNSKRSYQWFLGIISDWAGDLPAREITAPMVQQLYEEVFEVAPRKANGLVTHIRIIYNAGIRAGLVASNPATRPGLESLPPRHTTWSNEGVDAFVKKADELGRHSLGTAVLLAALLGQRQSDILNLDRKVYIDGVFQIRQRKTGRLVPVPATTELKRRIAATVTSASKFVINENTGRPYATDTFRHDFLMVKRKAAEDCPDLAEVWYMDLRRTCVVWLAEEGVELYDIAAVTGHEIQTCTNIVETYLPRSGLMAARAIEKLNDRRERLARKK